MPRLPDWDRRFAERMQAAANRAFAWGEHDCVSFALGMVADLTGEDPMAPWRGRYTTALGAARLIRRATGGAGLLAAVDVKFERLETPKLAQRGDLGAMETADGPALGICGGRVWGFVSRAGLVFVPCTPIIAAWRV